MMLQIPHRFGGYPMIWRYMKYCVYSTDIIIRNFLYRKLTEVKSGFKSINYASTTHGVILSIGELENSWYYFWPGY